MPGLEIICKNPTIAGCFRYVSTEPSAWEVSRMSARILDLGRGPRTALTRMEV